MTAASKEVAWQPGGHLDLWSLMTWYPAVTGQCPSSPSSLGLYCVYPSLAQLVRCFQSRDVFCYHTVFLHSEFLWRLKLVMSVWSQGPSSSGWVWNRCKLHIYYNYNQNRNHHNVASNWFRSSMKISLGPSCLGFSVVDKNMWLRLVLWEGYGVYLVVVFHKVDLQALADVVRQVREVLLVLFWQDDAGHSSTTGLKGICKIQVKLLRNTNSKM